MKYFIIILCFVLLEVVANFFFYWWELLAPHQYTVDMTRLADTSFLMSHDYGTLDKGIRYVEQEFNHFYVFGYTGLWVFTRGTGKVILYKNPEIEDPYQQNLDYKKNNVMKDNLIVKNYEECTDEEKERYNYFLRKHDLYNFKSNSYDRVRFGMRFGNLYF